MATNKILHSDLPIPPGEYLEEVLEELGIPKHELAKRMNRPAPKLSAIFKGQKVITPDTAIQLEKVVGVPAHIWTGLESDYRLALARRKKQEDRQRLKEDNHLVTRFCYSELVKHGVIQKKNKQTDKVLELHGFFGVNSLKTVLELQRYRSAFRAGKQERSPEAVAAWLRVGELRSVRKQCAPYNDKKLKVQLQTIRSMTTRLPEQFEAELDEVLVSCGISLVLFPQFRGTYANGATFWIGKQKAVVMMTIRYGWADIFWFSLFHELGHILMHKRQLVILEGNGNEPEFKQMEAEANEFAADVLIPPKDYSNFVANGSFYANEIEGFAKDMGIAPGVVVGRLQKEEHIKNSWHNGLRQKFRWKA